MPRDSLARMELDTHWVYHRKWRQLQRDQPATWPSIAVAWLALLGEAWRSQSRNVTLADAWPPSLDPALLATARKALAHVGLLDRGGRVPQESWDEWVGPTQARVAAGRKAAAVRWGTDSNAMALPRENSNRENSAGRERVQREGGGSARRNGSAAPTPVGDVAAAMGFSADTYPDGTPRAKKGG